MARAAASRARGPRLLPVSLLVLLASAAGVAGAAGATGADSIEPEAAALAEAQNSSRYPRATSLKFLQLISDSDAVADDDWSLRSLFSAPARRRAGDRAASVPLVSLPGAARDSPGRDGYIGRPPRRRVPQYVGEEDEPPYRRGAARRPAGGTPSAPRPARRRPAAARDDGGEPADDFDDDDAPDFPRWQPTGAYDDRRPAHTAFYDEDARPVPRRPADRPRPPASAAVVPTFAPVESSRRLVEMFRAQAPSEQDAALPAILQSGFDSSERVMLPDFEDDDDAPPPQGRARRALSPRPPAGPAPRSPAGPAPRPSAGPAPPRLARPLRLRAVLTVPRAGYSEPYIAWWEPGGDARVHLQDGATVTLRKALPGGRVRKVEMHVDRADGRVVRRCAHAEAAATPDDRAHPALPDLQLFTFAGYEDDGVERWQHRTESGAGGARGETLTTRHELLLRRDRDDSALPIRYSVAVDSSVLGADCDGYRHLYLDVSYHSRGPDIYEANLDELCDEVRRLNASEPSARARLEPLREFTLPQRDARYDAVLERFKAQNERRYADDAEEAVRKNLVMQSSRFAASGNRAGATFQLGLNFLGDRLDGELRDLGGVERGGGDDAEPFPHARPALPALERRLPAAFDWRERGGVTPVRFQGSCASCWAFATTGAVEGALFARSGRLTPLSEQQLVDCAHAFGARGCGGTWPSRAYDYVQARGLAALDDYTPYKAKVESCEEASVAPVTLISGHVNVTKHSVPALQVAIRQHGPAVVIVDSSPKSFTLYKKGVLYDDRCSKKSAKHAVLAVGWGQEKGEPHFILKNSWSEAWGERGYVRVQARANTCGVLTHPSYPRLERADVLQS